MGVVNVDMGGRVCNGYGFISGCDEKTCVDCEGVISVERDFGAAIVGKAGCVHRDGVVTDGENGQRIVSLRVGVGGVEEVGADLTDFDGSIGDEAVGRISNGAGYTAAAIAEGERRGRLEKNASRKQYCEA